MARPLVIFPIFPLYRYWFPTASNHSPMNRFVELRLREIDPAAQPFHCVELCNQYLVWRAQLSFNQHTFSLVVRALEAVLLWSFDRRISLLAWDNCLACEFIEFWTHPPAEWKESAIHLRYIPKAGIPFSDWPINEHWRLFRRKIGPDGKDVLPVHHTLSAVIKEARGLYDFYNSMASCPIPNPFLDMDGLNAVVLRRQPDAPLLSQRQLDWVFEFSEKSERQAARSHEVRVFLAFARDTPFRVYSIVGTAHNPGLLSQFRRKDDGVWMYSATGRVNNNDDWHLLPQAFARQFEAYLTAMCIDPIKPLPPTPLFPQSNPAYGYSSDAISQHVENYRKELANKAEHSADQEIRDGSVKFGQLNFSLIRRSAVSLRGSG